MILMQQVCLRKNNHYFLHHFDRHPCGLFFCFPLKNLLAKTEHNCVQVTVVNDDIKIVNRKPRISQFAEKLDFHIINEYFSHLTALTHRGLFCIFSEMLDERTVANYIQHLRQWTG